MAGLPFLGQAQSTWNGATSTDWNTAGNWSAGVPAGVDAVINTTNPRIATITSTMASAPKDIRVGTGSIGRVDHLSGNAFTGNGNWMLLGYSGGKATYNLADTTMTGGAFTGYGLGSGSLYVGGMATPTGSLLLGLDNGTVSTMNINSSGTVAAGYLCVGGTGANAGTLNLDNGTVNISGQAQIGGDQYGQNAGTNHLNISGGTLAANVVVFARGDNNSSTMKGIGCLTGGTLSSSTWLTLGFAGSATSLAAVTNSGGTINVNTAGGGNMEMTVFDPLGAYFKQTSGALNLDNNAYIAFGNGGNNSGTSTFDLNGGTVTFYSDTNLTVGGTGYLSLGRSGDSGAYTFNLNGGVLTVPQIQYAATSGSGTFNFNGGTLKPTANNATFMQGLSAANVLDGGAIIDTTNYNITIAQTLQYGGAGGLTKLGAGALTLSGGYSYAGPTVIRAGTLNLNAAQSSSASALTMSNAALNVSLNNGNSSLNSGNLTFSGTNVISFNFGTATSPSAWAINASGYTVNNAGTNIINISGPTLVIGQYPLIYTGSPVPTNNFTLGPLPVGLVGVLTNSGVSLDLLITASGQALTWYGADSLGNPLTTWDVNTSSNWNNGSAKYLQYAGNSYGDNVTFNDYLYGSSAADITLNSTVVPLTVHFNNNLPYSVTGSGGISGATSVMLTNSTGSVFLGTSNSYTGGTIVGSGTLAVTNDSGMGASSAALTLAGGSLQLNGPVVSARPIIQTASTSIAVTNGVAAQLNGNLASSAALIKTDAGTLALGGSNLLGSTLTVRQGTLNSTGTNQVTGLVTVSDTYPNNGVLTVSGGQFNAAYNPANIYNSSLQVGTAAAAGTVKVTAGSLTVAKQLLLGDGTYGFGSYQQSGGSATLGGFLAVALGSDQAAFSQAGGTFIHNGPATIGAGTPGVSNAVGVASFSGNAVYTNGYYDSYFKFWVGENGIGIMNVSGNAAVTVSANNFILGRNGGANGILNLNGGTLAVPAVQAGAGASTVNFNGGTLKAVAANNAFLTGLTTAEVYSNGASLDDGGFAVTVNQPLLAPNGFGVSSIPLTDGGAGYIDAPVVTISGGSGSNATAVATVAGGTVTGFTITSPGTGYSSGDFLSVSLSGGGATVAATPGTPVLAANVGGGLIKTGVGTLTLTGTNTYSGNTAVNGGTLIVTPAQQATNGVSVANGATYGVRLTGGSGTVTNGGAMILAAGATTLRFEVGTNGNTTAPILVTGPLTNNGTLNVTLAGSANKFVVGAFPLVKYGAGSVLGTLNPVIYGPNAMSITLSNDNASSTLYAVINNLGSGVVWSGTNSVAGKTNLWDLNTTTNWLAGASRVVYQETTPPGDAVTFNDLGSGIVLLSNTASPLNVTISNAAVNYTFNGSGHISGSAGLVKQGAGPAAINLVGNDYTGSTVISNGTLSVAGGQAIGDSSAVVLANVAGASLVVTNGETIGSLAGGGSTGGNVTINGGTLTTGGNNASTTFGGKIGGTGSLAMFNTNNSTLTLTAANNTYSGGTSIGVNAANSRNGVIRATADQALGSGTISVGPGGNDATARLELSGGISLNNAVTLFGRNNASVGIENISGNNALSGLITIDLGGGIFAIQSDAGQLTLGTSITPAITAASGTRTVTLQGVGNGNVAGVINNGGGTVGILKDGAGTWTLSGINLYTGATTVSNGTLLVNGSTYSGAVAVNGGTLGGTGIIGGAVTLNSGGTLSPGASPGTLTINGSLTMNAGSTNVFEVDAGGTHDLIALGAGAGVSYGGVLNIVPAGVFSAGQHFQLFSGAGATNTSNFAGIQGSPGSGLEFTFTNGVLSVVGASVGPAGPERLTNSYSAGVLSLSWPAGEGWRLQMQTNSLSHGLGTNWDYITDGSISSTNITVDPTKPTVFYRLKYP